MKFSYVIELKEGFKPATPLLNEKGTEIEIILEARNRATADRMIKALFTPGNVKEVSGICID